MTTDVVARLARLERWPSAKIRLGHGAVVAHVVDWRRRDETVKHEARQQRLGVKGVLAGEPDEHRVPTHPRVTASEVASSHGSLTGGSTSRREWYNYLQSGGMSSSSSESVLEPNRRLSPVDGNKSMLLDDSLLATMEQLDRGVPRHVGLRGQPTQGAEHGAPDRRLQLPAPSQPSCGVARICVTCCGGAGSWVPPHLARPPRATRLSWPSRARPPLPAVARRPARPLRTALLSRLPRAA
ncbi:hypothetical protein [Oryza sativa Japonica Group]|uniref:Uncharacterized protein n=1 Tax=Oryza sativa subsp. japonica TaxID=39947 RepID=Q5N9Q8_ORYSJ|nr:hypothetical protein [Oryza sativa Japonica Group]